MIKRTGQPAAPSQGLITAPLVLGLMRLLDYPELASPQALAGWINACLEQGLDTFDHADIYGDSQCEALFGAALAADPALKRRVRVITKTDIVHAHQDNSPWQVKHYCAEGDYVSHAIDQALRRLQVDRIDTFLIHRPDPLADTQAMARALEAAVKAGKIGEIGVSNFLPEQWRWLQANTSLPLRCNQSELSLMATQGLFDGTHEAQLRDNLQWLAWSPLGGGRLEHCVPGKALARAQEETGLSVTALAVAWINRIPGAPVPVLGSLRPERIREALAGTREPLPRELWFSLLEAARGHEVA